MPACRQAGGEYIVDNYSPYFSMGFKLPCLPRPFNSPLYFMERGARVNGMKRGRGEAGYAKITK